MSRGTGPGIVCPSCGSNLCVIDTSPNTVGIMRRRQCLNKRCKQRVTTYEIPRKDYEMVQKLRRINSELTTLLAELLDQ